MEIAVINNTISRLKILDKMMNVAIAQKKLKWDNSESKNQFLNIFLNLLVKPALIAEEN